MVILSLLAGCSGLDRVFPDRRAEYKKAEALPDLEVPPDLTADAINDNMAVPGERNRASLSSQSRATDRETVKRAEILRVEGEKSLLSIPEDFTVSWIEIENTLQGAGVVINEKDQGKGIFNVTYTPQSGEKKGWLSRLAFWSDDSETFLVSLTGVGDKTELVILDVDGEWETGEVAGRLLAEIRTQYNVSKAQ